jgi:hypothetical protein
MKAPKSEVLLPNRPSPECSTWNVRTEANRITLFTWNIRVTRVGIVERIQKRRFCRGGWNLKCSTWNTSD